VTASRYERAIAPRPLVVAVCALMAACGTYDHTNPYDPATNVTILIAGPDSAHSIHEDLSFTYQMSRSWEGVAPVWLSGSDAVLSARAPGQFQVSGPGTADVSLSVGVHTARHRVVVIQRPKHAFFCYFAGCPTSLGVGGVATLNVVQTDSLGTVLLPGQAPAQVQYDVRPAGVLEILSASPLSVQVKATGIGRVFVIAALGASLDSVAIQVQ
jgi:hypothetical protein